LLVVGICAAVGCSGKPEREPEAPTKQQSLDRSARLAFAQANYAQAATLYEAALQSALTEDEPVAIIDARFNLALCQTYLGEYDAALLQIDQANLERQRRGLGGDHGLQLLAGTVHYRAGRLAKAQTLLDQVLKDATAAASTRAKAHFIAGLMAADQSLVAVLMGHVDALSADTASESYIDRLELLARLTGLQGDIDGSLELLDKVAVSRRLERDYRGMARALAEAGALAQRAQRLQQAGGYFLRAGRSAIRRGDPQAVDWLNRARELGNQSGDAALSREAEAALNATDSGPS